MGYAGPKHPSSAPSGWTQLDDLENGTSAWLTTYYHVVGASEANSYAFNTTGGDFLSVVGYEITGQASSSFINQHAVAADSAVPQATPSVTPSVMGCLALAFVAYNDGTGMSSTPATIGSGWTMDQDPLPTYHSTVGAHMNSLTTDTTTPISASVTWGTGDTDISSTILIAPSATSSFIAPKPLILRQAVKRSNFF
jgi:hypothetical protein